MIVENPAPAVEHAPRWTVVSEPDLDLGTVEGDPAYEFTRIVTVVSLSDGTLIVAHADPPELRFFTADGTHLRTVGGEGEGPGEFRRLSALLRLPGDTLLGHDPAVNRVSRFSPEGAYLGGLQLEASSRMELRGRFGDGTFVVEPVQRVGAERMAAPGRHRTMWPLLAFRADGALRDTLLVRPAWSYYVGELRGSPFVTSALFGRSSDVAVGPVELYVGDTGKWEIEIVDSNGRIRRIVRLDRNVRPVTGALRDSLVEERTTGVDDPNLRRDLVRIFREMPVPDHRPAFSEMKLDAVGRLWVREVNRQSGGPDEWVVFGPEGRVQATATFPARFVPNEIGKERVLGTWIDDLEIPHLRVYSLSKGPERRES